MLTAGSSSRWSNIGARGALLSMLVVAILLWARLSGQWLIVDRPEKADVIVVLAGDNTDLRYRRGLELLRSGYGEFMFVDAETRVKFGEPETESSERFIRATAGEFSQRIRVCPIAGTSTMGETESVQVCVASLQPRRLLLVTDGYHSRRALSIFNNRLPQYSWSIAAAVNDKVYGAQWWRKRAWAKTYVYEWQRMLWWFVVDR